VNDFPSHGQTLYNILRFTRLEWGAAIKNQEILSIIKEVSETLSLTNKPKQLLETALDTLSEVLGLDCCWIQLVTLGSEKLPLIACRGFTPTMRREMASIDMGHRLSNEIIGLGHRVVIPNLNRDGRYDISLFKKAGFYSLIAVPIMTYRVHGIMGVAFRTRKRFDKDFSDLITVIANLIGMALNKSVLTKQITPKEKPKLAVSSQTVQLEPVKDKPDIQVAAAASEKPPEIVTEKKSEAKVSRGDFIEHTRRMKIFRKSHRD
jgi:signal transduction protein with GAF and PtsI domain